MNVCLSACPHLGDMGNRDNKKVQKMGILFLCYYIQEVSVFVLISLDNENYNQRLHV